MNTNLWQHSDFRKLWLGQSVSAIGTSVTFLALPLTAVLTLDATPAQMGLLGALEALPALLIGLLAGVWIDRLRRRPILIAANIGRAILLAGIPLAAWLGWLTITHLYITGFFVGLLTLFFDIGYRSYLPTLIAAEQLTDGNSKLEMSRSAAEIIGPGLAGVLIDWLTAPLAIIADALSYLISAVLLWRIATIEEAPQPEAEQQGLWQNAQQGLHFVRHEPKLRALAGGIGILAFFNSGLETIALLYMTRNLALDASSIGLIFASGSIGFLIGAAVSQRLIDRFGLGPTLISGVFIATFSDLLLPLAMGTPWLIIGLLIGGQFFFGMGLTFYNVGQVTLRQLQTPDSLMGRMNATMHVISQLAVPLGAFIGGALGGILGLRATLFLAVAGEIGAGIWLLLSPVRIGSR